MSCANNLGNNWIQKIPLTAKLDSAYGLVQFSSPRTFYHLIISQIGQFVGLLHIQIAKLARVTLGGGLLALKVG